MKFGQIIGLAGFIALGYGGYLYHHAEAKADQQIKKASQQMGYLGAVITGMGAQANQENEQKEAKKLMGIGSAIIVIGFALFASAETKKELGSAGKGGSE